MGIGRTVSIRRAGIVHRRVTGPKSPQTIGEEVDEPGVEGLGRQARLRFVRLESVCDRVTQRQVVTLRRGEDGIRILRSRHRDGRHQHGEERRKCYCALNEMSNHAYQLPFGLSGHRIWDAGDHSGFASDGASKTRYSAIAGNRAAKRIHMIKSIPVVAPTRLSAVDAEILELGGDFAGIGLDVPVDIVVRDVGAGILKVPMG